MKLIKKLVSRETFTFSLIMILVFAPLQINAEDNVGIEADASILIDADNGSVFNSLNEHETHGIASITKMMTLYVVLDQMKEQKIKMDDSITITERAAMIKYEQPYSSGAYLTEGTKMTYDQAIKQLMVVSDNGVAVALAENISKSEADFVVLMNVKAKDIGMNNTTFYNASGLTAGDYGDYSIDGVPDTAYNESTAYDVSLMAMSLLDVYPDELEVTKMTGLDFEGQYYSGHNFMLDPESSFYYEGVEGLKTGTSIEAGSCFVGYYNSTKTDDNYISVVLGADSTQSVFNQTSYIYNWIDIQEQYTIIGTEYEWNLNIKGTSGDTETILNPSKEYEAVAQDDLDAEVVKYVYNSQFFNESDEQTKDISAGELVAQAYLKSFDEGLVADNVGSEVVDPETGEKYLVIDLITPKEIKKQTYVENVIEGIKEYFVGLYNNVI